MARKATGLPYYGGKAKIGKWIADILPWDYQSFYIEPFGGMGGVLCNREPVKVEVLNDLNDRFINWWEVCRNDSKELIRLVSLTPRSRSEFERAVRRLDAEDVRAVDRAHALYVVLTQSVICSDERTSWAPILNLSAGRTSRMWASPKARIEALAKRFRFVQLECRNAIELLTKTSKMKTTRGVVYVDPPYRTAAVEGYRFREVDIEALTELLLAHRSVVAVSGYNNEWDHLGWDYAEKETSFRGTSKSDGSRNAKPSPRLEKLWFNRVHF